MCYVSSRSYLTYTLARAEVTFDKQCLRAPNSFSLHLVYKEIYYETVKAALFR